MQELMILFLTVSEKKNNSTDSEDIITYETGIGI